MALRRTLHSFGTEGCALTSHISTLLFTSFHLSSWSRQNLSSASSLSVHIQLLTWTDQISTKSSFSEFRSLKYSPLPQALLNLQRIPLLSSADFLQSWASTWLAATYRAWLNGGPQVWWILFLLLLNHFCTQHLHNMELRLGLCIGYPLSTDWWC